jgi:hypothetical protein
MVPKRIGSSARFFLTRYWEQTSIGPYVVTSVEVRPGVYETSVTWGEDGPEVELFGSARAFDRENAEAAHEEICDRVEESIGAERAPLVGGLPPAA